MAPYELTHKPAARSIFLDAARRTPFCGRPGGENGKARGRSTVAPLLPQTLPRVRRL